MRSSNSTTEGKQTVVLLKANDQEQFKVCGTCLEEYIDQDQEALAKK